MIIKGSSRGGPAQLARHLQRRDTNEKVEILELQSPAPTLAEAFRDWQILTEGTRGEKGLYHANIDPAKDYVMTPEQWQRSVEVLEKELGFEGQPRAVVMHQKHGRQHIHVVWARTDIDTMTLRSDSMNYQAHERASKTLELEFGHEPVPGKHAKRDREKQPEFPRADANHAEWQQGERTGIDPAARKDQITALKRSCDNGRTFKTALEEQGYILAKGDRRDFVLVDETGSIHSLGRQIHGMKAAELRAFMKDVDREALPSAAEAVALQRRLEKERIQEQPQQEAPKEAPAAPEAPSETPEKRTEAIRNAAAAREAKERERLLRTQEAERDQLQDAIDRRTRERLEKFDATHTPETEALVRRQQEALSGFAGFLETVRNLFTPGRAEAQEAERQRERDELEKRQKAERDEYRALLDRTHQEQIRGLKEQHARQLAEHAARAKEELARYLEEHEAAEALRAKYEEREQERVEEEARRADAGEEQIRDTPEKPPPKFTK